MFDRVLYSDPCNMHWWILLLAMVGVFLAFWFRKNRKALKVICTNDIVIMAVLAFLGDCLTDFIWMIVGILVMGIENFYWSREE